jgi:hypothetical protein
MKTASVLDIKSELSTLDKRSLVDLCMRLTRFKLENKELLTYLLFEAADENNFVEAVKEEIKASFDSLNVSHLYFVRKSLRKITRQISKYTRYSGKPETELELRIFFCEKLKGSDILYERSEAILRLYSGQLKKAEKTCSRLHEDIQFEYLKRIEKLKG